MAPKPAAFSELRQEPQHRHRDVEIIIARLFDEISKQRRALEKLTTKIEEDRERQLAADRERDKMTNALAELGKGFFSRRGTGWNDFF